MLLPLPSPPNTSSLLRSFVCLLSPAVAPLLLQLEDRGDRGIVLYVNTVYAAEVKIVPSSILSQQSQRWLSQKQYLDMAADVPK